MSSDEKLDRAFGTRGPRVGPGRSPAPGGLGGSLALLRALCACPCLLLAVLFAASAAGQEGSITGSIDRADEIAAVTAVDRLTGKRFTGRIEAASGRFAVGGLPAGGTYDLIMDYGASRLEGVDLEVPPSDYEEEQPLSDEDRETIQAKVRRMNKFEDVVDVIALEGNIQHAAVLVNKLRTRPFYGSKPGEVIWRVELWHFERPEETWVKVQDELFLTLYRERIPRRLYDRKSVTFAPALGGLEVAVDDPALDVGPITLPPARAGIHMLKETEQ